MQLGKCAIIVEFLTSNQVHCQHKLPRHMGGTDEFNNLVIVHKDVHRLSEKTIERYRNILQLDGKLLK